MRFILIDRPCQTITLIDRMPVVIARCWTNSRHSVCAILLEPIIIDHNRNRTRHVYFDCSVVFQR
jgi:hypothetical protein